MASKAVTQTEVLPPSEGNNGAVTRSQSRASAGKSNSSNGAATMPKPTKAFTTSEAEWKSAVPEEVPSILELKRILPAHCFSPSLAKSYYYVLKDIALVAALFGAMLFVENSASLPGFVRYVVTPLYWYLQGTMFWAIFVLGHDCGHGSFSNSSLINDITGNILHGFILVPYYPWKVSHRHHHKNTGNIDKDEIFYPVREKDYKRGGKSFLPFFGLGTSWFFYLVAGYAPRKACHVNPLDPLFVRHALQCAISLATVAGWSLFGLFPYARAFGIAALASHYLMPIFVFASWLVITTFLHHQDENVPWYSDDKWDFVRGQLSSVDRDYGWAHGLVHNIGTHQIHHLFSKIPHYNLEEATAVFRQTYPHLVRYSRAPILKDFAKMFYVFDEQQWIKDDTSIHVYNANKKAN